MTLKWRIHNIRCGTRGDDTRTADAIIHFNRFDSLGQVFVQAVTDDLIGPTTVFFGEQFITIITMAITITTIGAVRTFISECFKYSACDPREIDYVAMMFIVSVSKDRRKTTNENIRDESENNDNR